MKLAVTVILRNEAKQILLVSRKYDHTNFTLPGGKVNPGEDLDQAIIRETREETGLQIFNLNLVSILESNGYRQYGFTAKYSGKDDFDGVSVFDPVTENHIVKWGEPAELFASPTMGLVNEHLFAELTRTGTL